MIRRALILLLLLLILTVLPGAAQDAPDYTIRNIRSRFADLDSKTIIEFEVWNIGGAASQSVTASLNVVATGERVATEIVPPLRSQQIETVRFTFATTKFAGRGVESFRAAVGVGEIEAEGSANIRDNFAEISVTFPESAPAVDSTETPAMVVEAPGGIREQVTQLLAQMGIRADLSNPVQAGIMIGLLVMGVLLILLLLVFLRLILHRTPTFGSASPPYASLIPADPNSAAGRRHQWQMLAQNSSLPPITSPGALHIRKIVTDGQGVSLKGWRAEALRLSQYDQYGRVSRSQILASGRQLRRLNGVLRKGASLDAERRRRQLMPVADGLSKALRSKLNERTAGLPLALDVRLVGKTGEAHIWFELYQDRYGQWAQIDRWQPEVASLERHIHEIMTYSLFGLRPGETERTFRERLRDDLASALSDLAAPTPVAAPTSASPHEDSPTDPHLRPVRPSN